MALLLEMPSTLSLMKLRQHIWGVWLIVATLGAASGRVHNGAHRALTPARVLARAPTPARAATTRMGAATSDEEVDLNSWAQRWRVLKLAADGLKPERVEVAPTDAKWEALTVSARIERSADRPGIGLLLVEAGSQDGLGLVLVDGVAPGSNAAQLPAGSVRRGDVLVSARVPGGPVRSVEGLPYDETVGVLSSFDPAAGAVELVLKRQRARPALTVNLIFPQEEGADGEESTTSVTLYSGSNLRRSMLARGVQLNDPLARRFDAGVGTGDCGGEGCCCTCAVEVLSGAHVLSKQGTQERQMLAAFPRWRLACKAAIEQLDADETMTLRVTPRGFEGFYGKEECDINGKPLYRGKR